MALGTENQIYQKQQQSYKMLSTSMRSFQQQPHQRNIAPAPVSRSYAAPYTKPTSVYAAGTTLDSNNPAVVRRNARERNRVKQVNNGFIHLRQHLPTAIIADLSNGRRGVGPGANKKLSKVDTLRMALEYIRRLQHVIKEVDSSSDASSVSSYNTCGSSNSGSPPPLATNNYYKSQYYSAVSYAGTFQPAQPQPQQPNSMLISPANSTNSTNSSSYSADSFYNSPLPAASRQCAPAQLKYEQSFDDYGSTSGDDEDILDYISLWQEDL